MYHCFLMSTFPNDSKDKEDLFMCSQQILYSSEQESIPVGCVPPALSPYWGRCCPGAKGRGGAVHDRKRHRSTSPPVDRQAGVKTLPYPKLCLRAVMNTFLPRPKKTGTHPHRTKLQSIRYWLHNRPLSSVRSNVLRCLAAATDSR